VRLKTHGEPWARDGVASPAAARAPRRGAMAAAPGGTGQPGAHGAASSEVAESMSTGLLVSRRPAAVEIRKRSSFETASTVTELSDERGSLPNAGSMSRDGSYSCLAEVSLSEGPASDEQDEAPAECGQPPAVVVKPPTPEGEADTSGDVLMELSTFVRQCSIFSSMGGGGGGSCASSFAGSDARFAEPTQTLIIFDWDDTLFPTTEFSERWRVAIGGGERRQVYEPKCSEQAAQLLEWRQALREYLEQACALSSRCCIITNSRRPWVSDCIERFCPELKELFDRPSGPRVIYAGERLPVTRTFRSQCMDLRPVKNRVQDLRCMTAEELEEELTLAKYMAMRSEARSFYSQYPNQSWKNLLSIGDMRYERDAVQELSFRRVPHGVEKLRTKALILPTSASLSEITMRLQFSVIMLPAYVAFNGDFDVDLADADDPLLAIGEALGIPELAKLPFSRHAWGRAPPPENDEVASSLAELAVTVHDRLYG